MVQLSMTLSDLWPRFQGHDIFRHWISQKKTAIVIDLEWPLNASSPLSASAELLVLIDAIRTVWRKLVLFFFIIYQVYKYINNLVTTFVRSLQVEGGGGFCPGGFCQGGFCPGSLCPGGYVLHPRVPHCKNKVSNCK